MSSTSEFHSSKLHQGFTQEHANSQSALVEAHTSSQSPESRLLHLVQFMHDALDKGWNHKQLEVALLKNGWSEDIIKKALVVAIHTRHDKEYQSAISAELSELTSEYTELAEKNKALHDLLSTQEQLKYTQSMKGKFTEHFFSKARRNMPIIESSTKNLAEELKKELDKEREHNKNSGPIVIRELGGALNVGGGGYAPPQPTVAQKAHQQPGQQTGVKSQTGNVQGAKQQGKVGSEKSEQEIEVSSTQRDQVAKIAAQSSNYVRPASQHDDNQSFRHQHYGSGQIGLYNPVVEEKVEYTETPKGDRAQTGIPDLDPVISGGFTRLSSNLVSGGAGTGKTTFALQYLVNGVIMFNEPGVYITFEQSKDSIFNLADQFGWDLANLEKQGMLIVHEYTPEQVVKALEAGGGSIRDLIDSIKAKRLVVDSITEFEMMFSSEISQRRELNGLFKAFAKWNCTTVIIGQEHSESHVHVSSVLDYEADAVILLYNERKGDIRQRALEIYKMRGTKHAGRIFPMRITEHGVVVRTNSSLVSAQL